MAEDFINHIVFVLDASSSMDHLTRKVVQVADDQIARLRRMAQERGQETRFTVYTFNYHYNINCVFYDRGLVVPSLKDYYKPYGLTALLDATELAVDELKQTATLHGDHAFLVYVLTDGDENDSRPNPLTATHRVSLKLKNLPENWTLGILVPDAQGVSAAQRYGFPKGNIMQWDATSEKGVEDVGAVLERTTAQYYTNRAAGVRGTNTLFQLHTQDLTPKTVRSMMREVGSNEAYAQPVSSSAPLQISDFYTWARGLPYHRLDGKVFYPLTKQTKVQPTKEVALREKTTGKIFRGTRASSRALLGLPDDYVKIGPTTHPDYEIFLQSTSQNRVLERGTDVLIFE